MQHFLESSMYYIGQFFLIPTLILIALLFLYALGLLGEFIALSLRRRNNASHALLNLYKSNPALSEDELDLAAHKMIEAPRLISRVTPMLGLVATMIPMGPALKALSDGNLVGVSENMVLAFSAVILSLLAASITYYVVNIRRRWLAEEMLAIAALRKAA